MAEPFSKERQLARGERRYRRKVASPKQWQAIVEAKGAACVICTLDLELRGPDPLYFSLCGPREMHHLVARAQGGDDMADNIVCLCQRHHQGVTARAWAELYLLSESLTEQEIAYCQSKLGPGWRERLFGV